MVSVVNCTVRFSDSLSSLSEWCFTEGVCQGVWKITCKVEPLLLDPYPAVKTVHTACFQVWTVWFAQVSYVENTGMQGKFYVNSSQIVKRMYYICILEREFYPVSVLMTPRMFAAQKHASIFK